jgi:hypothetical protein
MSLTQLSVPSAWAAPNELDVPSVWAASQQTLEVVDQGVASEGNSH